MSRRRPCHTGLAEMSDASKAGIFETILGDFLSGFTPEISSLCSGLVQSTIDTFNDVLTQRHFQLELCEDGVTPSVDAGRVELAPDAGQEPLHVQSAGPREGVSRHAHGFAQVYRKADRHGADSA